MRTLHWFFSLGLSNNPSNYVITMALAERLRPWFPEVCPGAPGPMGTLDTVTVRETHSVTAALLQMLGPPALGLEVRFHLHATRELVQAGASPPSSAQTPMARLLEEAPDWARGAVRDARGQAAAEWMDSRDPKTIEQVVKAVVDGVGDGDLVLFETTHGLRPFVIGSLLAHSVLRADRPDVQVVAALYGELGGWKTPAGDIRSPLFDLTGLLDLPLWASAADSLRRRFDVRPAAELFSAADGPLAAELDALSQALDLGWPRDVIAPLRSALSRLREREAADAGSRVVLARVLGGLEQLAAAAGDPDGPLDASRLRFHLDVAAFLVASNRFGDAIRVLRESMVDGAILALRGGSVCADWRSPDVRGVAEVALFRSGEPLWQTVGALRNAASHAKSSVRHDEVDDIVVALRGDAETPGLVARVRTRLLDGDALREGWLPAPSVRSTCWYRPSNEVHARAHEVERLMDAFTSESRLPLVLFAPASGVPPEAPRFEVFEVKPARTAYGKNWAADRAKRARGARDAVLDLAEQPMEQALLAEALRAVGVRPWALQGDRLWPLFPQGGSTSG